MVDFATQVDKSIGYMSNQNVVTIGPRHFEPHYMGPEADMMTSEGVSSGEKYKYLGKQIQIYAR